MKFTLARTALALAATLTLASCGGGGKATFPIHVTVENLQYTGLVLSTNGQDLAFSPTTVAAGAAIPDVALTFPNELEYGTSYNVLPKGYSATDTTTNLGAQPKHQTCSQDTNYPRNFPTSGTAGQLATIQIYYLCGVNTFPLSGTVKGLKTTGLVLANGSTSGTLAIAPATDTTTLLPTGADVPFALTQVAYAQTYGVSILTQPAGQTCVITSGGNGATPGSGVMDDATEAAGGVTNLVVTCQ